MAQESGTQKSGAQTSGTSQGGRLWLAVTAIIVVIILIGASVAVILVLPKSTSGKMPPEVRTYIKDWPLPNRDYNNSRATNDTSISASNVATLGMGWSFPIPARGTFGGAASTPIIMGNTVYFQDLKANVFALDLQTGTVKWSQMYNASFVEGPNGPGVGYGKVFVAKDAFTMAALDINTGKELWTNRLSPVNSTGIDIQPLVYDGKVYVSSVPGTGDLFYKAGGIGVLYALNQATGAQEWNFSTVKGDLWGHPEVNSGGGCWYPPAIDTKTGTMYWDVANPAPFAGAPGWPSGSSFDTALYTNSVLAMDHSNGKLKWFTQALHHDIWDHDLQVAPILASANISGEHQNIILASGKMGNVYCLNRDTGNLLWMLPVGEHSNDTLDPILKPTTVLPGVLGGVETQMAYSDGILYVPVVDLSTEYTPTGLNGSSIHFAEGKGELVAIDVEFGHILWTKMFDSINVGSATVANDVVFTATFDGTIYAFHAKTGQQLFKWKAPVGINAWPAIVGNTVIWPAGVGAQPQLIALRLGGTPLSPSVSITSPTQGQTVYSRNVTTTVSVSGFNLVNALGSANVAGEGHIHFFLDVLPPTTPGVPAITAPGTYAPTASTSYTWPNVSLGTHMLSVELVNNDHTPLVPYVVAFVNVTVSNPLPTMTIYLQAQSIAFNMSTITVPHSTNLTVIFMNMDAGIPHNFAVYTSSAATTVIYQGSQITGVSSTTYKFTTPSTPGTYFFRCDVHPTQMTGSFIVT